MPDHAREPEGRQSSCTAAEGGVPEKQPNQKPKEK